MAMIKIKKYIKRHPRLKKIALSILGKDDTIHQFRSLNEADRDIVQWIKTFNQRYDAIIGIPRSGLYIGSFIAIKLGLPLSTPDLFIRGIVWQSSTVPKPKINKVLLVDDGVGRVNGQLMQSYEKLKNKFPELEIIRAALYIYPDCEKAVDTFYGYLAQNRGNREEWNIMHRKYRKLAVDMDGVLAHDWNPDLYQSYEHFVHNTQPYLIPQYKIDYIITNRNESYRKDTIEWLNRYNVQYEHLIMNSNSEPSEIFKSNILKQIKPDWYWESNYHEAVFINNKTGIPVLSIEGMKPICPKKWW